MEKLRIVRNIKVIEVNDDGETIILNLDDQAVPKKLLDFSNEFKSKIDIIDDNDKSAVEKLYEISVYAIESIDNIFGKDTSRKVFGDIVPPIESIKEFIEFVTPYYLDYSKERFDRLQKYSPDRNGSVN